ncbi:MAG: hypothetical protein MJ214_02790 [Bacilli bacterium]|nr:hypothetical protein [Bacilli bacterium]
MTKNIKFIAPLALVAFGTLASCGGGKSFSHLNRVEYKEVNSKELVPQLNKIFEKQYAAGVIANLFKKGTINLNYSISLNGDVRAYIDGVAPIDVNGINISEQNSVTFSWSIDDEYLKATSKTGTTYIIHDKADNKYYKCFDIGDGQKYKVDLFEGYSDPSDIPYFSDIVIAEAAKNCGLYYGGMGMGVAFGLTGQGTMWVEPQTYDFINFYEIPGALVLADQKLPETLGGIAIIIDGIDELDVGTGKVGSDGDDSVSLNVALTNLNLAKIQDYLDKLKLPFDLPEGLTLAGNATLDYFFAFAENFIKQQELIFDLDKVSFVYESLPEEDDDDYTYVSADFSANAYIGEEVIKDKCTVDTVNTKDYTTVKLTPGGKDYEPTFIVEDFVC